jgi:outer membrane protein assembly factor BamD
MVLMAAALAAVTISGCSGTKRPKLAYEERPVEALYNTGYDRLQQRRWSDAVDYFQEVERQHPYSDWARRSILMQIYAYYQNNNYADAIAAADRFIQLFPGNPSAAYAFYMKAVCNFEQITDVGRDQGYATAALAGLKDVSRRYPGTPYASDAAVKIDMVNDQLAGKEMDIGRYYMQKRDYTAAINRFKTVVTQYQTTRHVEEALFRLTEAYMAIGIVGEAQTAAAVLGHNFPDSRWYKDAYNLVKSGGLEPSENQGSWISKTFKKMGLG